MEIYIPLAILWFIGVLWWDVTSDYKKISNNIPIPHERDMLIRCLLLTPSALGFLVVNFSVISIFIVIFMQGAWYWEFFDGWLNKKRGKPWRWNGTFGDDEKDQSKLDSFLYHLSSTKQALLKWGLIIIFTTAYILTKFI